MTQAKSAAAVRSKLRHNPAIHIGAPGSRERDLRSLQ
jgi:hypothetical protein